MKKLLVPLLCLAMVLTSFVALAEEKPDSLTFLHTWGAETHPNKPMVDSVVAYVEAETGISLEQESLDASGLQTKIATLYSADEGPDLVRFWSGASLQPYAENDKVLNLDPYLDEEYLSSIVDGALSNYTFNGHVYALPMGQSTIQLFVNKAMLDAEGLELPTTWDALMNIVEHFAAKGSPAFAMGLAYDGASIANSMIAQLMVNAVGLEKYNEALNGEIDFASEAGFTDAVNKYIELVNAGAFSEGAVSMDRDECEVGVFNGTIPLYHQGSWVVQQYYLDSSTVNPDDIVIMNLPKWEGCAEDDCYLGTFGDAFMVSASTEYPEHAAEVLKLMAKKFGTEVYERGQSASAYLLENPDETNLTSLFIKLREYLESSKPCEDFRARMGADAREELAFMLESLQIGDLGAEDFIAGLDEIY